MNMYDPLDQKQVARIEAVHRGFLYQHLYAAGCLLLAGESGVRSVTVEMDEDVEVEFENGNRLYVQIKTRSAPLILSDIASALERFEQILMEHSTERRSGEAAFAIVANVLPGPGMQAHLAAEGLKAGAILLTPEGTTALPAGVPPAWADFGEAVRWCAERAQAMPMATLEPETLVWKLAGRIQLAAAGQAPGHTFPADCLHQLFEQLAVQLQQFPAPPDVYRPLEDEPALHSDVRVRIVSGLSGAGKTAWAAQAALHMAGACAYFDVGDVPGTAIATSLVRELAAQWAAGTEGGLRRVLMPGAGGIEALRALDRFLGAHQPAALVVLDNAHRVPAEDLRRLIEATNHLRFVLLAQPSPSLSELEASCGLHHEDLRGWSLDHVAAEAHEQGVGASTLTLGRLLALTGGLPLYVRSAVQLCAVHYAGDASAMCESLEAGINLVETAQELILRRTFEALPEQAKDCVAVLSLSDVPLSQSEAARLVSATFEIGEAVLVASLRKLRPLGVIRIYGESRLQVHDAFRVLGQRRFADLAPQQLQNGRRTLKELIVESFERRREPARFPLLIRMLVELGELKALVDVATEEWFHELGVDSGMWAALETAAGNKDIDAEQRFYALDGLVFADIQKSDWEAVGRRLAAMEVLAKDAAFGAHEQLIVQLKRMMFEANQGHEAAARRSMRRVSALVADLPNYRRIVLHNIAFALWVMGLNAEAESIAKQLVEEYFIHLGLTPKGITGKSNREIRDLLTETPTMQADLKHLADSLDILARSMNAQGRDSGLARVHAAKLYALANALSSFVKICQDLADEFVQRGDPVGAREVIEEHLLPVVTKQKLLDKMVPVRSQYAVILAYCGEHDAAAKELEQLMPYRDGLSVEALAEFDNQVRLTAKLRRRIGSLS